jgi:hypothetical protein
VPTDLDLPVVEKTPLGLLKPVVSLPTFPASQATLGWGIADWIEGYLLQPDGDLAGEPFRLTDEQLRFILWFYAVDEHGRFLYRRGVLRRAKGWGKSPFLGALCLAELLGPVRFSHFDEETGEAVGERHPMPWVVIAGVSETQTENTMAAIRAMSEESALVEDYGLDVGMTRILVPGGGKLHPITASSSTQEGARPSFAVMDETHHWTRSNGGWALAKVIRRNLAKSRDGSARAIETTNAHEPGQESVAEGSYKAWRAAEEGRTRGNAGLLYDTREAPLGIDLGDEAALRQGLRCAYGDATWLDEDRLVGEIYDPDTPPEEARRFYLNQIVAAADSWIAPAVLARNDAPDGKPLALGEEISLGFDGSLTDDSTVLVGVRMSDGAPFILGAWEKPEGPRGEGWEVEKSAVRGVVDFAFAHYRVAAFFSDVAYWETDVDAWRDEYGETLRVKATTRHAIAWDMRGHQQDTVRGVEALHRSLTDGETPLIPHRLPDGRDGLAILKTHTLNARRRPNRWGVSFGKETRESPLKVDALAAWTLARMARTAALGAPSKKEKRAGRLYGF